MKPPTLRYWILLLLLGLAPARMLAADDAVKPNPKTPEEISRAVEKAITKSRERTHGIAIGGDASDVQVKVGKSVIVRTNETVQNVVVVFGDVTIDGTVEDSVVVVGGDTQIRGKVGDSVVTVWGRVELGPESEVGGEVVGVGRGVERAEGAKVSGEIVPIDLGELGALKIPEGVRAFFLHCVLKFRPLSFRVGWVWWVAGAFLLGYLLLALAFPRGVAAGVAALEEKPALSLLLGILAKPLVGIISLLLAVTGIGVFVVPFLLAGLFVAAFFGKAAVMQYLGLQFGRQLHSGQVQRPLVALLVGAAILTLFYLIPVVGLAAWAVSSMWGMGAILMALGSRFRREAPPAVQSGAGTTTPGWAPPLAITPPSGGAGAAPGVSFAAGATSVAGLTPGTGSAAHPGGAIPLAGETTAPPIASTPASPPAPEAWSLPRVGFWRRALATLLDSILLGVLTGVMRIMPAGLILWVAYYVAMWAWRGTTIGGIVVGIKVVRLDGRKMDFATALVRSLGAVFSTIVLGIGYFWAGWDRDKQGWHDKIAGTVVVRVPHGQALVMF